MNAKSRKMASKGLIKWGNIQKLLNLFWRFAIFSYICNRYGNTLSRTHSCGQLGRYDLSCHSHLARGRYGALRGHTHVVCPAEAFEVQNRLVAHHKFNEHGTAAGLVERLKAGAVIALVSDAGTPGISDPGFLLAREAIAAGVTVQTLPGATAFVPALVSSGLPCDRFCFEGFLPQKKGRQTMLEHLKTEERTMIFYESPYRVLKTLEQFAEVFGEERRVSCCREISKVYEESVRGSLREVIDHFREVEPKGEFVIVLAGAPKVKEHKRDRKRKEETNNQNSTN